MSGDPEQTGDWADGLGRLAAVDDALGWAVDVLQGMGREVVAEPMTLKDRAWSRVVRLTTEDGTVWLKVNRGGTTYEPALVEALGRLTPESVDEPLAVAGAWMLTSDGGPTLRDVRGDSPPDLGAMSDVMREYAALQRATIPHSERLLALDVPDLRPALIPAAFDDLLGQDEWMRVGQDGGISEEAYARLLAHRPVLADACARLATSPIPGALQHDDLHDNNVFVPSPGIYRIFDWGDASIAHPFGTLLVSLRSFAAFSETTDDDPRVTALRDAYLDCWTDLAPIDRLTEDARLAISVAPVGRALSWQRALVDAGPEERAEWQDSVWGWLEELLPRRDRVGCVEQPVRRPAERTRGLGTTIFAEMSALATATGSVNLGQGFPDTDGPLEVVEAAIDAIRSGVNQYPPGPGTPALRESVAFHRERFTGLTYDPDTEVLITTGATEAIAAALLGLVDPGDEVVVLEPYYDSYVANIAFAGGVRRPVTLRPPTYALDVDELRAAVTSRTRVILINTPHNPTGAVLSRAELSAVAELAVDRDLVVIVDEVYEHMTYERPHVAIATLPGMRSRTLSIGSAGKTFSMTGWKIGWVTGPADLVAAVRSVKQFLTYTSGAPFQPAIALGLRLPDSYFTGLADSLRVKRDRLCTGLSELGLEVHLPAGTYFATTDVRPLGYDDGMTFCRELPTRAGVVAIPHSVFWDDQSLGGPLVRWAFCKQDNVIDEALARLGKAFA